MVYNKFLNYLLIFHILLIHSIFLDRNNILHNNVNVVNYYKIKLILYDLHDKVYYYLNNIILLLIIFYLFSILMMNNKLIDVTILL